MSDHKFLFYISALLAGVFILSHQQMMARPSPFESHLRSCSFTGPAAQFCSVNVSNQLCVNGNPIVGGFANTLLVAKNGDDATASRAGSPFLTISAALAQAQFGDLVLIYPGIYNETINIPLGVSVSAVSRDTVTIQQLDVTTPTDLVTMGQGTYLGNCILQMSSSEPVQLRAIFHTGENIPGAIVAIDANVIFIDNSAAVGSSDVYGIYMSGEGSVGFLGDIIFDTIIQITTGDAGKKRALYIDSPTLLEVITPIFQMFGGTDTIAFEVNNPTCVAAVQAGALSGDPTTFSPDISQTQGTLDLDATYLGNSNANGLGFGDLTFPATLIFADADDPIGGGFTLYLRPGTGNASNTPIFILAFQKFVAREMSVRAITPSGAGELATFTLQRNGIDTPLSITLTNGQTSATLSNISVHFSQNDDISMKLVTSSGSQIGDVVVEVAIY